MAESEKVNVLIASFLEEEHVHRIGGVDPRIRVINEPDLLRPPRYPADHKGSPRERTPAQEARWRELLATADVLFDFDQTHREDLPELAPNVRWIQSTSSGIGLRLPRFHGHQVKPHYVVAVVLWELVENAERSPSGGGNREAISTVASVSTAMVG